MSTNPPSPKRLRKSDAEIISERDSELEKWKKYESAADKMIPIIGQLYRVNNVICTLFGRGLVNQGPIEILKIHSFVSKHMGVQSVTPEESLLLLQAFSKINPTCDFQAMRVDLGRAYFLIKPLLSSNNNINPTEIISSKLQELIAEQTASRPVNLMTQPRDVVLYGFGRIGRLLARLLIEKSGAGVKLMLRAIVVRKGTAEDLQKRASLLRRDSVHGAFNGTISFNKERNAFIANGNMIQIIYASSPDTCDYTSYGIRNAIVIDNTGKWRDKEGLSLHLKSKGVSKVILTAPGKGSDVTTIVSGVNNDRVTDDASIYSAASCTTNAIAPVLSTLEETYGIESGHIETVHSFTNDQNLIDNYHPKDRRGRSAVLNMVLTETGAAKAVVNCIPSLKGKLSANAIRVPTPNVSLAILMLKLGKKAESLTKTELNTHLARVSMNSPLQNQIDYLSSSEAASSDFVGCRAAGVVDGQATIVKDNQHVNLYVWYDNEFGYSCQVIRLLQRIANISHVRFPDETHVAAIDAALHVPSMMVKSPTSDE